ncbi:MAG TPA: pyridoxal phosphate-dependent aminotransferase [bacterium]|nr:pyridoxal phosphate-dependent aminotransferase [bacterium]
MGDTGINKNYCCDIEIPEKAKNVKAFLVMEIMEKAEAMERAGADIVHLEVGEPDFETPPAVVESAVKALRDGKTHYTHSMGLLELREAIAEDYFLKYGVTVDPECIIVTSGTSSAMTLAFSVLVRPGYEVAITDPHYACYPNFIRFADGIPSLIPVGEEDGFQFKIDRLRESLTERTCSILINSPSNPGGTLIAAEVMKEIAEIGIPVVSDEIYHGLVYGDRAHSILEYTPDAFVINGFSKLYAMTGWRVGYVIAPKKCVRTMQKLHQNFFISANSFVQWAAITALKDTREDTSRMVDTYNERRKFMLSELKAMGFNVPVEPTGAFYMLVNMKHVSTDSYKLAFEILEKAKVAVTPGIDFGPGGEGFIRFSYANSIENIGEGMKRLRRFLAGKGLA